METHIDGTMYGDSYKGTIHGYSYKGHKEWRHM